MTELQWLEQLLQSDECFKTFTGNITYSCKRGIRTSQPTNISREDLNNAYELLLKGQFLLGNSPKSWEDYDWAPYEGVTFAICEADLLTQLEGIYGFLTYKQYAKNEYTLKSEIGCINNIRFLGIQGWLTKSLRSNNDNKLILFVEFYKDDEFNTISMDFHEKYQGYKLKNAVFLQYKE